MGLISGLAKIIVFVFNFLCALVGLVLIIVGSICYVAIDKYYELTKQNLSAAPSLVIAVGVIVFIIAFLGCCGVTQKSRCMLFTYAAILLILFIIQIVAGAYGYVQVNNNSEELETEIMKALQESFKHKEPGVKPFFDSMQIQLECCGVEGASDYIDRVYPASCCGLDNEKDSCNKPYMKGCGQALYNFLTDGVKIVAGVALGICVVELIGAIFAIYLGRRIDHY